MNKKIIIGALTLIAVIVILSLSGVFTPTGSTVKTTTGENSQVKEFRVDAFRFGYSPETIAVNKGDKVKIIIDNTDVPHGIRIPDFKVGGENEIEFTADKAGEFTWYCFIPCGSGHMTMKGTLIVK